MIPKPKECSGCPLFERPHGKPNGFSFPVGTGKNGVMVVAEALGKDEEIDGIPLVGKSGYTLFQQLKRVDIEREDFTLYNVLACRPPDNKLAGMSWERGAIAKCAPNLDKAIAEAHAIAKSHGKTFVILTLGNIAFKRVLGLDHKKDSELLKKDHYAYPFWSDQYSCWVLNAPHPAYLLRGNTHLWPLIQFVFTRAIEIANGGLILDEPDYLLDPTPTGFDNWILGYLESLKLDPDNPLSYDIETPYKKWVKGEDDIGKEEDADHTILRISFSYFALGLTHTVSIKWSAEFMAGIERLFKLARYVLGWNSDKYDYPRVSRYVQVDGIGLDGMVAWHILNSSLPKSLGFVTPYYWQNTLAWKYLADSQPAFYNAKDADAALRNFMGIKRDLIRANLWHVYERHWIELSKALKFMTGIGVLRDNQMRDDAEKEMTTLLDSIELKMEEAVPQDARKIKIYKKAPKDLTGLLELTRDYPVDYCSVCGLLKPKRWKKHAALCGGAPTALMEAQTVWGKPLEFKVSKLGMSSYQKSLRHHAILSRKEHKITFDADAITKLIKRYPKDPLYPRVLEHRKISKLLNTYVGVSLLDGRQHGGMQIGKDGRIHTQYGRDANTLRFTSEDPNLQNLPRPNPSDPSDLANIIRNLIVAAPGHEFGATDFAGIEAVLVGYFALYPEYIRLALRDVHTFLTVYAIHETEGTARIKTSDLPELNWPDDRLFPYLEQLKKEFKKERNNLYKHIGHAFNFGQGTKGTQAKVFSETGVEYPLSMFNTLQDIYFSLFPKIRQWQKNVTDEAEKDGYLRNPFDYIARFSKVFDYKKELGTWVKTPGPDWNRAIAYKPQSTAVGIITEAILDLYFNQFEEAGKYLRLQVHDELLYETPEEKLDNVIQIVENTMNKPIPQLRLPTSWGMGEYLRINVESKRGHRWGLMK